MVNNVTQSRVIYLIDNDTLRQINKLLEESTTLSQVAKDTISSFLPILTMRQAKDIIEIFKEENGDFGKIMGVIRRYYDEMMFREEPVKTTETEEQKQIWKKEKPVEDELIELTDYVIKKSNFNDFSSYRRKKLAYGIEAYFKRLRDRTEALRYFMNIVNIPEIYAKPLLKIIEDARERRERGQGIISEKVMTKESAVLPTTATSSITTQNFAKPSTISKESLPAKISRIVPPSAHRLITRIVQENNLSDLSDEQLRKLVNLIQYRAQGKIDFGKTIQLLQTGVDKGGVGIDYDKVKGVARMIESEIKRLLELQGQKEEVPQVPQVPQMEVKHVKQVKLVREKPVIPIKPAPVKPEPKAELRVPQVPQVPHGSLRSEVEGVKPREFVKPAMKPDIIDNPKDIKSVSDISKIKMNIFRGKGLSPKMSAKNILDRIEKVLQDQNISRDAVVSSWKSSEPYKLYLAIGRESMQSDKTIEQIFSERRSFGKPYLTREEFDAVADISKSLQE